MYQTVKPPLQRGQVRGSPCAKGRSQAPGAGWGEEGRRGEGESGGLTHFPASALKRIKTHPPACLVPASQHTVRGLSMPREPPRCNTLKGPTPCTWGSSFEKILLFSRRAGRSQAARTPLLPDKHKGLSRPYKTLLLV